MQQQWFTAVLCCGSPGYRRCTALAHRVYKKFGRKYRSIWIVRKACTFRIKINFQVSQVGCVECLGLFNYLFSRNVLSIQRLSMFTKLFCECMQIFHSFVFELPRKRSYIDTPQGAKSVTKPCTIAAVVFWKAVLHYNADAESNSIFETQHQKFPRHVFMHQCTMIKDCVLTIIMTVTI